MFGLMKGSPREVYCGTCKSLGTMYGNQSRLLLNHDTVFLAEVLLDLADLELEGPALRPYHCFKLPKESSEIPLALQYAAAVTVVLAHFRAADHGQDARRRGVKFGWRLTSRILSPVYRKADAQLRAWDFPIDELAAILATQPEREATARSVDEVAEPTMLATALVFERGVKLVGRDNRVDDARRLGAKFGQLIYLLDALEDRDRDARAGAFNPIPTLSSVPAVHAEIMTIAQSLGREMPPGLAARLCTNVEGRLGLTSPMKLGTLLDCGQIGTLQPALAFASSPPPPPPATPIPPPPPPHGQFRVARPDPPSPGARMGGCMDQCKDSCMEGIVEAICDSVCG